MTGIYKITNKNNNKVYIGQSQNISERLAEHKKKRFIPIDMWINMLGVENFTFEILEECDQEDLDQREQYYINKYEAMNEDKGYNKQSGGFNNSIGEGNGRALLSYEDVVNIRTAYANHESQKKVYQQYKDKITLAGFQSVWQGRSWNNVMPEVFTPENKKYYVIDQSKETASLTKEEVLRYRRYYVTHSASETYELLVAEKGAIIKLTTFKKILSGDVRTNSIYNDIPVYKKSKQRWELKGEPVSTILESEE